MLPIFRRCLVLVLVVLQLLAPLVHAHTGNNSFNQGLHIPGLELYHTSQDTPLIQTVNADWASEGLLVVVAAGIKYPQDIFVERISQSVDLLLPSDQIELSVLTKSDNNFLSQNNPFSHRRIHSQNLTRAPPTH